MKKFMYLSIAILCLSLAALIGFHIGSQAANAQPSGPIVGYSGDGSHHYILFENGDVYKNVIVSGNVFTTPAVYSGNFWTGSTVPTQSETWGKIKSGYKTEKQNK